MRLLITLPEDTRAALKRETEREGVSMSLYVVALIETHLALLEKLRVTDDDEPDGPGE